MDLGLKGRRALVMGGTKGLGRSIADALAAEGASIVISGRDQGRLDQAAAELKAAGCRRGLRRGRRRRQQRRHGQAGRGRGQGAWAGWTSWC